ncbi:MAG: hypothetical protein ACREGC_02995, partial [Minisyncoccia bacterium]
FITGGGPASINASGNGAFAVGQLSNVVGTTSMLSSGNGSMAAGFVTDSIAGSTMTSSGSGSFALGEALGSGNVTNLTASGNGSFAMGLATNATLQATGTPSFAMGQNVQATANNTFALGSNVINNNTSTFMVGFNASPTLTVSTNVGIGTITPGNILSVNGAVGIGTANSAYVNSTVAPPGGMIVQGNIGIGSLSPGQKLDVQGTSRMTGFTLTNNGAAAGNVMVSDALGVGTWMAATTLPISGGSSQWTTINTNDVYLPNGGNVGLGTANTAAAALTVMNGNVGIGTWSPSGILQVNDNSGSTLLMTSDGALGIGTFLPVTQLNILANNYGGAQRPVVISGGYCNHCEARIMLQRNGNFSQAQWFQLDAANDVNASEWLIGQNKNDENFYINRFGADGAHN